ncbi:hypothetical protein [Brevundimonas pishanensis]|uniref:hypothetical protein n=1 Tax=Brevundimonas pishanensis TaxID=2896315 RepID=UPI001FA7F4BE|nr:hypothetical protein [Brevundimonas pishanensis]
MKISHILAGAAAIALVGSAANAGTINQGQFSVPGTNNHVNVGGGLLGLGNLGNAGGGLGGISQTFSAWHAVGASAGNNGSASGSDGATFTLKGKVDTDCAFYSGSAQSHELDFGTLGIYASDNTGPGLAFDMVAPASVAIYTNLAGCNTANTVKLTKNHVDGLRNTGNTGGYDTAVFTANLPFTAAASYTAVAQGAQSNGTVQTLTAGLNQLDAQNTHGAWKSPLSLTVTIPVPSKALLAGTYNGSVAIEISAL